MLAEVGGSSSTLRRATRPGNSATVDTFGTHQQLIPYDIV
jgi:hypothetical protein